MDAAPDLAPPPPWHAAFDRFTRGLVGRDMATRFGANGRCSMPAVAPPMGPAARARLAGSVVFLLPGGPWPGVGRNGAAWLGPWGRTLRGLGVGRAIGLPMLDGLDPVTATFAPVFSQGIGFHEAAAAARVRRELAERPPRDGGGAWLLGHSYGALVACDVATRVPGLRGLVLLEAHLATTGLGVARLPDVPLALVGENEAIWPASGPYTRVKRVFMPGRTHLGVVLQPPARLLAAIARLVGGEEVR